MLLTAFWGLLPFSRGSVHIKTLEDAGPSTPAINPNFFQFEWGAILQSATARLARRALRSTPLSGDAVTEVSPGEDAVPLNATTDEQWTEYFKRSFTPNYQPVGMCAMMARELGGVVDAEARVYRTGRCEGWLRSGWKERP